MGPRLNRDLGALALIEPLECRRLMSVNPAGMVVGLDGGGPALEARARPNLNFVGNYLGTVTVKNAGKVSFHLEIDVFDPSQRFILGSITFIPVTRIPFDGTYKINGPTFTYTASKFANSLTLTGKLVKLGKTLTGKFTLVQFATTYTGKYTINRQ